MYDVLLRQACTFSLKDVAASQYVCSRGADNLSSYFSSFGSDLSTLRAYR